MIQGDVASAAHWAGQMTEGIDPAALGLAVGMMQARLSLAQGKQSEAGNILAGVYEAVAAMGLTANMIEVRALQALAADSPRTRFIFCASVEDGATRKLHPHVRGQWRADEAPA